MSEPRVTDWRDAVERFRRTDHVGTLSSLVDGLPPGGHVVVTCPAATESDLVGVTAFMRAEIRRCHEATHLLDRGDLRLERGFPHPSDAGSARETRLLRKLADPPR